MSDLRAFDTFDATSQATLRAGGTVTGGDGRKFVLINGHATVVGSPTYTAGMATRASNLAPTAPVATPAPAPAPPGTSPAPAKGGWMTPSTGAGVVSVPGQSTADATDKLAAQRDALALIRQTLADYGLPDSLADWAWSEIVAGKGSAEIMLDLRQRPEFKAEFPEIDARAAKKLAPLSPGDIIAYRQQARQLMRSAGLPEGFYDNKDDFTNLLANDVSINELNDRVNMARDATFTVPPEVRARLASEFGITPGSGALIAYFLDDKRALPLLQRDFQAGRIGGAADRTGYINLGNDTARSLADLGVSEQQAQQGFSDLQRQQELFTALPGSGEDTIDQQTQIGAEFGGNANAQRRIEARQRRRVAEFQGGGDFATSQQGIVGLARAVS